MPVPAPGPLPPFPRRARPHLLAFPLLLACAAPAAGWVRTELFLGRALADGGTLTPAEVDSFLAREAGPRLQGWTVLEARGRWTRLDGGVVDEPTSVLLLVHPPGSSEAALEQIRQAYIRDYGQDSVLRVDAPAAASF